MEYKGKWGGYKTQCHGCTSRAVGCHNPETCEAWREFRADRQKRKEYAKEHITGNQDLTAMFCEGAQRTLRRQHRK